MSKILWSIVGIAALLLVIGAFWHILIKIATVILVVVVLWVIGNYLITNLSKKKN